MARPWFKHRESGDLPPLLRRLIPKGLAARAPVTMTGWAIGGQRHRRRVAITGKHRAGRGIVGYQNHGKAVRRRG